MSGPSNPVAVLVAKSNQPAAKAPVAAAAAKPAAPTPPKLKVRTAALTIKPDWEVLDTIVAEDVVTVSEGPFEAEFIEPKDGKFALSGDAVSVKIRIKADAVYQACEAVGTVKVVKKATSIKWLQPAPVLLNSLLGSRQLNAVIDPATQANGLVYTPASGFKLEQAGPTQLAVRFGPDAAYQDADATVSLTVSATENDRAKDTGKEDMLTGRAWGGPTAQAGKDLMTAWDEDTGKIRTEGKKIMAALQGKTGDELIDYMDAQVKDAAKDILNQTHNDNGSVATYPNKIWKFANGLQVRYKSKGDIHNPGVEMFCVEGQTNTGGFSRKGADDVAFKVMDNGDPGCPGVPQAPGWVNAHAQDAIRDAYKASACGLTHLKCKPKDEQVIIWVQPDPIFSDTKLSARHLSAKATTAADPAFEAACSYVDASGNPISVGSTLPPGLQPITAIAAATKRLKERRETLDFTVNRHPQTITWTKPVDVEIGEPMNKGRIKRLDAKAGTPVTYRDQGGAAVTPTTTFGMAGPLTITASAEASVRYEAAAPVSFTIQVTYPKPVQKPGPQPRKKGKGKR